MSRSFMSTISYKVVRFFKLLFSSAPQDKLYFWERIQKVPFIGKVIRGCIRGKAKLLQRTPSDYARMQKRSYETFASFGVVKPGEIHGDAVVGSLSQQDTWPDYEMFLMKYVHRDASWIALDYGCGPGRNIRRWSDWFKRIDGVDISQRNLDNA